jgi:tetratricopeptide (TPR) repeat protein
MPRRRITNRRLDRWLRGEADLAALLALSDDDLDELAWHAHRRLAAGSVAEAERLFGLLVQLRPGAPSAWLGQGACRQAQGATEEALRLYDAVLQAEPDNVYALANRAEVLLLLRRGDAARDDLRRIGHLGAPADLRRRAEWLWTLVEGAEP